MEIRPHRLGIDTTIAVHLDRPGGGLRGKKAERGHQQRTRCDQPPASLARPSKMVHSPPASL
jgi:hypothetical protein